MDRNVDAIAAAYIRSAEGDCRKALHLAIADALTDLLEAERRTLNAARLISHGYSRGEFAAERAEDRYRRLSARASGVAPIAGMTGNFREVCDGAAASGPPDSGFPKLAGAPAGKDSG